MSWINVTWQGGKGPTPPAHVKQIMPFSFLCTVAADNVYAPPMGQYVAEVGKTDEICPVYMPWDIKISHISVKPLANTTRGPTQLIYCAPDPIFAMSVDIPVGSVAQQIIQMDEKVAKNTPMKWKIVMPASSNKPYIALSGWWQFEVVDTLV